MNLRDAIPRFYKLVREVEATGVTIDILRNGEPAVELRPSARRNPVRELTPLQKATLKSMLATARRARKSSGLEMTRAEMHAR